MIDADLSKPRIYSQHFDFLSMPKFVFFPDFPTFLGRPVEMAFEDIEAVWAAGFSVKKNKSGQLTKERASHFGELSLTIALERSRILSFLLMLLHFYAFCLKAHGNFIPQVKALLLKRLQSFPQR